MTHLPDTSKASLTEPFYIALLRSEFVRRKEKNPAYSLNAFAKQLDLDQSLFSKILSGKKKISDRLASELLLRAGITVDAVGMARGNFKSLDEAEFEFLSDWLPFAILELAKTRGFKWDARWIAKRLKVHTEEVHSAMRKLEEFCYISVNEESGKVKLEKANNTWANTKKTSLARRQLQKKLAEMSVEAIENVPFEWREHGSLTIAIDAKRLPELKERLNQFRMELGELFQSNNNLNEVYQITMSAFPLTKIGDK